ncbi:MAG: peptide chain release factor 2, partial [Oscillospiraceae bacterium]|nr:peptide chain release factor 2 [Oscillospiraceae bacterium]
MILLDELKNELNGYRKELTELGEVLNIKKAQEEVAELQAQAAADGFWDDLENSQKVLQKTKQLENKIAGYEKMQDRLEDI